MNPLFQSWLLQTAIIFLIIGSLAGTISGALLLLHPQSLNRIGQFLNRWISTRHLVQSLERMVDLDPLFYRHRRTNGALTLMGAIYILYFFTVKMDRANAIAGLSRHFNWPALAVEGLLDALVLSAMLGALFSAFVSLFLLMRPSLLREFEQGANQWLSLRRALKPMEIPRKGFDEIVFQYCQRVGIILVLGSSYALVLLTFWLSRLG